MSYKKKILSVFVLVLVLIAVGYAMIYPEAVGLCENSDRVCIGSYPTFSVGEPLAYSMTILAIILLLFFFLSEHTFTAWKKFAIWAIPLGAILIALTPVSNYGAGGIGIPSFDREIVTWVVSLAFLLVSFIIIAIKSSKTKVAN
ncbi:MAG: hypothetical protein AAB590_02435 [Patescibacteria group bacterium]